MRKYRNIKTNGYDSKKEATRAAELKLMEKAGVIENLREQVEYELLPPLTRSDGTKERAVKYIADFVYEDLKNNGELIVEDCKGMRTDTYIVKRKLMLFFHGITIKES